MTTFGAGDSVVHVERCAVEVEVVVCPFVAEEARAFALAHVAGVVGEVGFRRYYWWWDGGFQGCCCCCLGLVVSGVFDFADWSDGGDEGVVSSSGGGLSGTAALDWFGYDEGWGGAVAHFGGNGLGYVPLAGVYWDSGDGDVSR